MKIFVGITDYDWFSLHRSKETVEEVNFWRPSPTAPFKALQAGEPFLFKLHAPRNFIVGGGFFVKFLQLLISLAWDAFGEANGATSLSEIRTRISRYRRVPIGQFDDPVIGCILLQEPFFFEENEWIPVPKDFSLNIVQGKGYETNDFAGAALWREVGERLERRAATTLNPGPATKTAAQTARYGIPTVVQPRLGQGTFRALVTDAYDRRCAISREKTLPVLEAAHIQPYADGGPHRVSNGLLLRRDIHRLFDLGYLAVDADDRRVIVSRRIKEEFENGREYYAFAGRSIALPTDLNSVPSKESLSFHCNNVFRG